MSVAAQLDSLIDRDRLSAWLDANAPELGGGPLRADLMPGGGTTALIALHRGGETDLVLRRARVPGQSDLDKTIEREAHLLQALGATAVPHPHLYACCDDPAIIGASFHVTGFIDGWSPRPLAGPQALPPPHDRGRAQRRALAFELVGGLIALATADIAAPALTGPAGPGEILEREPGRALSFFDTGSGRDLPGAGFLADWLRANAPAPPAPAIVHGGDGFASAMFAHGNDPRLLAFTGWGRAALGDPLLDLAGVLCRLRGEDDEADPASAGFPVAGFPCHEELAEYYAEGTGRDIAPLHYYQVLARLRLAASLQAAGVQAGVDAARYREQIGRVLVEAEALARRSG